MYAVVGGRIKNAMCEAAQAQPNNGAIIAAIASGVAAVVTAAAAAAGQDLP